MSSDTDDIVRLELSEHIIIGSGDSPRLEVVLEDDNLLRFKFPLWIRHNAYTIELAQLFHLMRIDAPEVAQAILESVEIPDFTDNPDSASYLIYVSMMEHVLKARVVAMRLMQMFIKYLRPSSPALSWKIRHIIPIRFLREWLLRRWLARRISLWEGCQILTAVMYPEQFLKKKMMMIFPPTTPMTSQLDHRSFSGTWLESRGRVLKVSEENRASSSHFLSDSLETTNED